MKYRYRSPVVFEFHVAGKRGAAAYAQIWLQHLTDNEECAIDIPIWTTKNGNRLTQNYITERNWKAKQVPGLEDLEEVGRLQFRGRFKAGMDESHRDFIVDNDTRETFESYECCLAGKMFSVFNEYCVRGANVCDIEGVRERVVEPDIPDRVQTLHENSLTEGRDILQNAPPDEKKKWLSKSGEDWSGAFGDDPKAYVDGEGRKIAEPGRDQPPHDPANPSDDEDNEPDNNDSDSSSDLGINDASSINGRGSTESTRSSGTGYSDGSSDSKLERTIDQKQMDRESKRTEKRKQRGLMQVWASS